MKNYWNKLLFGFILISYSLHVEAQKIMKY